MINWVCCGVRWIVGCCIKSSRVFLYSFNEKVVMVFIKKLCIINIFGTISNSKCDLCMQIHIC
jgi:hypothetical protein